MKFPRNARIFRGRLDMAPFAAVFFLMAIFLLLSSLVYTPGVSLQMPLAEDLPGTDKPTVSVAIDATGRYYHQNQLMAESELSAALTRAAHEADGTLTLLVHADKGVSYEQLIALTMLAREAGISSVWLATLPGSVHSPLADRHR